MNPAADTALGLLIPQDSRRATKLAGFPRTPAGCLIDSHPVVAEGSRNTADVKRQGADLLLRLHDDGRLDSAQFDLDGHPFKVFGEVADDSEPALSTLEATPRAERRRVAFDVPIAPIDYRKAANQGAELPFTVHLERRQEVLGGKRACHAQCGSAKRQGDWLVESVMPSIERICRFQLRRIADRMRNGADSRQHDVDEGLQERVDLALDIVLHTLPFPFQNCRQRFHQLRLLATPELERQTDADWTAGDAGIVGCAQLLADILRKDVLDSKVAQPRRTSGGFFGLSKG